MGLLDTAVISFVVIVLLHLTLKNMLSSYPGEKDSDAAGEEHSFNAAGRHPARDEMLDFVRGHLMDLERGRRKKPKGSNYYNDFHDSDLHHERTDLSKFFEVEQSVPDTKELLRQIAGPDCGPGSLDDCRDLAPSLVDPQTGVKLMCLVFRTGIEPEIGLRVNSIPSLPEIRAMAWKIRRVW